MKGQIQRQMIGQDRWTNGWKEERTEGRKDR